jgi:moderate conductance mechanosensitive channel
VPGVDLSDLRDWAFGRGLEALLIAIGAVLLARVAQWAFLVLPGRVRDRPRLASLAPAGIEARRAQAIGQASAWLATALVYLVATITILAKFNVPLAGLVPPATVAGVAVGFGAQRVVQDLLSGFFLLAERQLNVGDVVRISPPGTSSGVSGTVEEVTLRVTRLRTVQGEVVFVPNGEIRQVTNLSVDWARLVIDVPLRADEDIDRASEVLAEVGRAMRAEQRWTEALLEDPEVLGVEALDLGYLRLRLTVRTRAGEQWEAGRELRRRIADAFNEVGIVPIAPVTTGGGP